MIPDVLRALERGETVSIRNPHAVRPWQHVLEPLSGYLKLAQSLFERKHVNAEAWNFGPFDQDVQSVQWIVQHLCQLWGTQAHWSLQPGDHPHEASYLKLDISKARDRLQWSPRWSLSTALDHTTQWHQAWLAGQNMHAICLQQISAYESAR